MPVRDRKIKTSTAPQKKHFENLIRTGGWQLLRFGVAVVGSFLSSFSLSLAIGAPFDIAVLAVVVAATLGQEKRSVPWRKRVFEALTGFVVTAGLGIGLHGLFHSGPPFFSALAVVIVGTTFLANVGRFGKSLSRIFLRAVGAVLFFPAPMAAHLSGRPGLVLVALGVAVFWNALTSFFPDGEKTPEPSPVARSWAITGMRAVQLGAGLLVTLTLGFWWLPAEVPWAFITVYLVLVSTRTRGEIVVKGLSRFVGALVGAMIGLSVAPLLPFLGPSLAPVMLAVLVLTAFLRQISYAWWAGGVTLLLTLLYAILDPATPVPIGPRLLGIALGAGLAIASAFTVAPLRTRRILRGYLGRALAELDSVLAFFGDGRLEDGEAAKRRFRGQIQIFLEAARAAALHRLPQGWHPAGRWISAAVALEQRVEELATLIDSAPVRLMIGVLRSNNGCLRKQLAGKEHGEPQELSVSPIDPAIFQAMANLNCEIVAFSRLVS